MTLVRRIMKRVKVDNKSLKPRAVLAMISKAKNEGMIDYKIKGKNRYVKNEKLNSYLKK